jgi:hypothetical protein
VKNRSIRSPTVAVLLQNHARKQVARTADFFTASQQALFISPYSQ